MPAERSRAGSRPGRLSAELQAAITAEVKRLDDIEDPVATIAATGDLFAALDGAVAKLGEPRIRAVAQLRAAGWTYEMLSEETGLSKGRIQQLAQEAVRRNLVTARRGRRNPT